MTTATNTAMAFQSEGQKLWGFRAGRMAAVTLVIAGSLSLEAAFLAALLFWGGGLGFPVPEGTATSLIMLTFSGVAFLWGGLRFRGMVRVPLAVVSLLCGGGAMIEARQHPAAIPFWMGSLMLIPFGLSLFAWPRFASRLSERTRS